MPLVFESWEQWEIKKNVLRSRFYIFVIWCKTAGLRIKYWVIQGIYSILCKKYLTEFPIYTVVTTDLWLLQHLSGHSGKMQIVMLLTALSLGPSVNPPLPVWITSRLCGRLSIPQPLRVCLLTQYLLYSKTFI